MKTLLRRTLLCAALAMSVTPAFAKDAPTSPFTQTIFFGDSLTDGGFFRPLLPSTVIGQFTTNPGYVWSQYLSDYYGSNAAVAWKATGATPTMADGTNWAVGGAKVGEDAVGGLGYTPSLTSQYGAYLASGHQVDANALYSVWGGANDLFAAVDTFTTTLMNTGSQEQAMMSVQPGITGAVTAQIGLIGALTQAGAQYILVPNIPDLGATPSFIAQGAAAQGLGTLLSQTYNNALFNGLSASGLHVIPMDTYSFLHEVIANPAAFGLTNVTGQACLAQPAPAGDSSLFCTPMSSVPNAGSYLFADGVHPTSTAHQALADYAVSLVEGPRLVTMLSHSATTIGRSRAAMVDGAVAGLSMADGDGVRWWADVRGDQQRFNRSLGFDGMGVTGSFGIGWRSGNKTFGAFAGYGQQNIDFGYSRGDFRQTDTSIGGFASWNGEHLWASGQASWTKLGFKVNRQVNLGQATRIHSGSPDGDNFGAGASVGWNFHQGAWEHGPVLSVLWQNINVDGYAENSQESTALAYPKQNIDSLFGSLGWQASYSINDHLRPYVRATWDREFKDAPAQAWAQSQSMPGTLPYAVPGVVYDRDYGNITLGVRSQLGGLQVNSGLNLTAGQKGGDNYGLFVTVGGSF